MLAKSKNDFDVFIDEEHLKNHFDPNQSGGTFLFENRDKMLAKIASWIGEITLPPETFKSFFGNPTPPPGEFKVKTLLECSENIGWDSLVPLKKLPENTKVEWVNRRGYLTKTFPEISPVLCKTVVLIIARIDQKGLEQKINNEIAFGKYKELIQHPHCKFFQAPTEWFLLTAFPGLLAPPQSDLQFWDNHGFATGKIASKTLFSEASHI